MPAAPVLATHATGGRIAARRLGVRAAVRDGEVGDDEPAPAEVPWSRRARAGGFALEISVEALGSHARITAAVRNPGSAPRALSSVALGFEWSAPVSGALYTLRNGWQSDSESGPRPLDATAEAETSHQVCAVGVPGCGPCALVGAYERGQSFARTTARARGGGARIDVDLCVGAELAAGECRTLETVEVAVGDDAAALLEDFGARWGRSAAARTWRPLPTGWRSGRMDARGVCEADLLRALDALVASRDELPVEVVQLEDGYQRAVGDWLVTDTQKFRRGLASVAAEIRAAGFVPGLWTAPLCAEPHSDLFRAHPDWFLGDRSGPQSARWPGDPVPERHVFALDASRPAVTEHLEELFRTLVEWGFFHLQVDALAVAAAGASRDPGVGAAARMRRSLEAMRRGAGDEAFLLASGCPLGLAVGLIDAMRVAPDAAQPGAMPTALARQWMHRRLWLNDPGPLPCRAHEAALSPEAWRARAAAIGATGGVLFTSGAPAGAAPAERAVVAETFAAVRATDARGIPGIARTARPLDPAGQQVVHDEPIHLSASPLAVFCDFDGTFSVQDVGSTLAARFAAERRPAQWARYERGEITPWEYNLEILDGLPVGTGVLDEFLATVELDPGARDLVAWCNERQVPFQIVSDGFDWNLNRLQTLHRIRFGYAANRLRIEHGRWRIRAGAPDPTCGCGTGTCKRALLRAYRAARPAAHLVHIGNGRVSDTCGALAADTAFAKDSLAEWLEQRGVPFIPFKTLRDVLPHLESIWARLASTAAVQRPT